MKSIIEEMYYGDLSPFGDIQIKTEQYLAKRKDVLKIEDELLEKFPESKELLEHYFFEYGMVTDISDYQQFLLGFRVGAQIMLEMLKPID